MVKLDCARDTDELPVSLASEKHKKAAEEKTLVLLNRFSGNPDVATAKAEVEPCAKVEVRFQSRFRGGGFHQAAGALSALGVFAYQLRCEYRDIRRLGGPAPTLRKARPLGLRMIRRRKSGAERSLAAGGFLFVPVRVDLIGRHRIWRLTPFNKV